MPFATAKPPLWTQVLNNYHYFLPSLDLNLLVTQDIKVRADFSRTEDAPPNGQLIPNTTYGGRVNALTATGNNPDLLPYLSNNFDLGAEWYYGANSYVSADLFLKHVTNFPTSSVQVITRTPHRRHRPGHQSAEWAAAFEYFRPSGTVLRNDGHEWTVGERSRRGIHAAANVALGLRRAGQWHVRA